MATALAEVYDVFMMQVTDYRLVSLYNASQSDFEKYLQVWLEYSISEFDICNQSLSFDNTSKEFTLDLELKNKIVLATLMKKYWLTKLVNDVSQMNLHITDRDFKVASEAQNLREKTAALLATREECSQLLVDYGYKNVDWEEWFAGNTAGV